MRIVRVVVESGMRREGLGIWERRGWGWIGMVARNVGR